MESTSSLVKLSLERNAWKDVEKVSRAYRERALHAFAKKRIKDLGERLVMCGLDEMDAEAKEQEEKPIETEQIGSEDISSEEGGGKSAVLW